MVLKLVDCTEIIKALHPGIYSIFMFDRYCGRDRLIEARLNVMRMNSVYGRIQQDTHLPNINQEVVCLGLHMKII